VPARLSHVLAQQVPDRSRSRGQGYFQSGAVRSLTVENGIIQATVRGSDLYTVWIEPVGALIRASCTCPYFIDHFDICKHIWAVVLAAEARSMPLLAPGVAIDDVELEPLYTDELDEIDDDDTWRPDAPTHPPSWRQPAAPPSRRPPAPPAPWRQLLDAVSAAASPAPTPRPRMIAPGQLLYIVDVPASIASGALVLELMTRDRKMNGDWGKPRPARVTPADIRSHPDETERQLLERLLGPRPHYDWVGGWDATELSRLQLRGALVGDIVPLVCATGRCMLRTPAETAEVRLKPDAAGPAPWRTPGATGYGIRTKPDATVFSPIAWDDGPPWTFAAAIRALDRGAGYAIEGWLARDGERMALTDPAMVSSEGLLFTPTHAARLNHGGAYPWLVALRRGGQVTVPEDARDALIDALLAASPPMLDVPDELRVETVRGAPQPQLRLRPMTSRPDRLRAELAFAYEGTTVPAESPHGIIRAAGSTRAIARDADAERRALDALHQRGCRHEWSQETGGRVLQLAATHLSRTVRALLDEGWHVEAAGRTYRRPGGATLSVTSGIDWFELHGHVAYDDQQASLPALLAALDKGEAFVTLGDGTIGLLPEDWLRKHAMLARLGSRDDRNGDHLRFKPSQVALLDALIAAQPEASWDATFARARKELQRFDGIQATDPPKAFVGTLRGYQREGLGWLIFLQRFGFGGCLADDMGLGKTVMVLALLASRSGIRGAKDPRPSLVVAPRSVVFNWREEAARFAPGLRVLEYVGSGRAAMRATFSEYDVVLTTYGTLRRDAADLAATPFDYVVLDEAQAIKNAASVSAKTTRLLDARHRLALSGTPIENHLGELWSLFEFLNPGLLSTATAFNRTSARSDRLDDDTVALLARGLRPFILRRTKDQVAKDLPPKTEQTLYCELERPQRALYDELRAHYRRTLLDGSAGNGLQRSKMHVLEALLRLRQASCHPGLIDRRRTNEASAKLDVLVPRLAEAFEEGHKTLVFSQFTSLLAILRARLDERKIPYEYLDGRTRDRQSKVERFQNDASCRLFLISLKAGGLGLNLTAAEYVFLLDPWWNPAVEAQAIDRAHRIGQSRHVFAYRLIARDTVEERVLELQQRKRRLADAILTADNSLIRDLRREDLELLLS
jgi:superfamily II DNA or RNA helicase